MTIIKKVHDYPESKIDKCLTSCYNFMYLIFYFILEIFAKNKKYTVKECQLIYSDILKQFYSDIF